jgi:hypothetical protein
MRSLAALSLASLLAAAAVAVACSSTDTTAPSDDPDANLPGRADADRPTPGPDADKPSDAGADVKTAKDANGPGEAGAECSFNRDCQSALRCECDESTGCACKLGTRGTGQNGVDACDSGNQCASAVCLEGPPDAGFFCTDECAGPADCPTTTLPQCTNVAFVGQVCTRTPPK